MGLSVEVGCRHAVSRMEWSERRLGNRQILGISQPTIQKSIAIDSLRIDMSGGQGIDPDLLGAQFASHATCHLQDGGLASIVGNPSVVLNMMEYKYSPICFE